MKKGKLAVGTMLLATVLLCAACGNSVSPTDEAYEDGQDRKDETIENSSKEDSFEGTLSENDMEQSHLTFTLTDNVYVDADILTPYSTYKDGLNAYYTQRYVQQQEVYTKDEIQENITLLGHSLSEMLLMIEGQTEGVFDTSKMDITFFDTAEEKDFIGMRLVVPLLDSTQDDSRYMRYEATWFAENGIISGGDFLYVNYLNDNQMEFYGTAYDMLLYNSVYEENLSFADAERVGSDLREFLTTLLGAEIHSEYICVPVSENTYQKLDEQLTDTGLADKYEIELPEFEKEYYQYYFYRDIDGFAWKGVGTQLYVTEDMNISEELSNQFRDAETLMSMNEYAQEVVYDESGIRELIFDSFVQLKELYKEIEPVLDLNELLLKVKEQYDSQLVIEPVTILKIELCYGGYFSDPEDGAIRNTVQPFWHILAWDERSGYVESQYYNAYNGKLISVGGLDY